MEFIATASGNIRDTDKSAILESFCIRQKTDLSKLPLETKQKHY